MKYLDKHLLLLCAFYIVYKYAYRILQLYIRNVYDNYEFKTKVMRKKISRLKSI